MTYKPMLATDWYPEDIKFPCLLQGKIDGVRSINREGNLLARSLKPHENKHTTELFSIPEFHGVDGEMTTGDDPTGNDLCRITSGDLRRHDSVSDTYWWLFDYVTEKTIDLSYARRMHALEDFADKLSSHCSEPIAEKLRIIASIEVNNMDQLLEEEDKYLNLGYEGVMLRDPDALYKNGRCGKRHMGAWRVKRFIDAEAVIYAIEEGQHNANEAKTNALGRTERSTAASGMQSNGLVGNLKGKLLKDVLDPQTKKKILSAGDDITISPGEMDHKMRKHYFDNPQEILQKIGKFKFFPKGVKDKPRFATFICIRSENDM